jgi:AraC family transcriptional regulator
MPQPRTQAQSRTLASREVAGLRLAETSYPARLRMLRHAHAPASFSLVLSGGYEETAGARRFDCRPATLVCRPPEESHAVAFHDAEVRIFRVEVGGAWLERARECRVGWEGAKEFAAGSAQSLALRLYKEFRAADQFSALAVEGLALELLAEVVRTYARTPPRERPPAWLAEARDVLRERLTETFSLAGLARRVGVHPVHLAHEFRRHYGESVGEYARRLRVEEACRLVAHTRLPLCVVATRVGFYDQSHFTNAFKRGTGMTPAAYRALFGATESFPNQLSTFQDEPAPSRL